MWGLSGSWCRPSERGGPGEYLPQPEGWLRYIDCYDGGPAQLAQRDEVPCDAGCVEACHLCYCVRTELRGRFPDVPTPDQMYAVFLRP